MKVKIFESSKGDSLESIINDWTEEKNITHERLIKTHQSVVLHDGLPWLTITIVYK